MIGYQRISERGLIGWDTRFEIISGDKHVALVRRVWSCAKTSLHPHWSRDDMDENCGIIGKSELSRPGNCFSLNRKVISVCRQRSTNIWTTTTTNPAHRRTFAVRLFIYVKRKYQNDSKCRSMYETIASTSPKQSVSVIVSKNKFWPMIWKVCK